MKIKSTLIILLVLALVLSFAGCKKNTEDAVSSDVTSDFWGDESESDEVASDETDVTESKDDTASSKPSNGSGGFVIGGSSGGGVAEEEAVPGLPALSSKVKNKTVRYLTHVNASSTDKSVTKLYIKQYDMTVEYITVPYENKRTKLVQMIAAGDAPDLIGMDETYMTLINNNLVQPVEKYFDFSDKVWDSVRDLQNARKIGGKIYEIILHAVPSRMVFYNAKLFKNSAQKDPLYYYEKGQWNWDKMVELAKKMTQDQNNDGITDQWGFGGESLQFMVMGSVNEAFIKLDKNGKVTNNLNSPNLAKAMKMYTDLQTTYKVWPSSPSFNDIVNGKLAMGYFGTWNISTVEGAEKMWKSGDLAYVPTPSAPGMKNYNFPIYESSFIPVGAKNPDGAAAFVVYMKYREAAGKTEWPKGMKKVYDEACKNLMTSVTNRDFDFSASYEWGMTGDLLNGKSWSTIVAEYSPKIDANIAELN